MEKEVNKNLKPGRILSQGSGESLREETNQGPPHETPPLGLQIIGEVIMLRKEIF
jgi:hypothetical protein